VRFVILCHSLVSDWNHGNAHFLRGVSAELQRRGHEVRVLEPRRAWSVENLIRDHGTEPLEAFAQAYPTLSSERYDDPDTLDLDVALAGADVVLVHEWNDPSLVARVGQHRAQRGGYTLLFHDTHHRAVSDPSSIGRFDLSAYDGVLAFGDVLRDVYLARGWARRVFTWHEAADTAVFHPRPSPHPRDGDLVWIGNWGDDERTQELRDFLIEPVKRLGLRAVVHGVRYPASARALLADAGIEFRGWLPNFRVPEVFARFRVTVHVPRRHYVQALPGIPTIRPFEALACGMPLVCSPWDDREGLFRPGQDYLVARDGDEMTRHLRDVLTDADRADALAKSGLERIHARHTCGHRVDQLLGVVAALREPRTASADHRAA
jgi:spore maturation protein CgeB